MRVRPLNNVIINHLTGISVDASSASTVHRRFGLPSEYQSRSRWSQSRTVRASDPRHRRVCLSMFSIVDSIPRPERRSSIPRSIHCSIEPFADCEITARFTTLADPRARYRSQWPIAIRRSDGRFAGWARSKRLQGSRCPGSFRLYRSAAVVIDPTDNDNFAADVNATTGIIELNNAPQPYFDIRLYDGGDLQRASSGVGSIRSPSIARL